MIALSTSRRLSHPDLFAALLILVTGLLIVLGAFHREYLNISTETDFIGTFQPEALRFLNGDSMKIEFHLPLYPMTLATVYQLTGTWMSAALLISAISAILVLVTCYACLRDLLGAAAGLGALAAVLCSATFFSYSAQATSDIFFLAAWWLALYATVLAMRRPSPRKWLTVGLLVGASLLMRSNGIVLFLLLGAPLLMSAPLKSRFRDLAIAGTGFLVPVLAWLAYAASAGIPFAPTKTYANLALTYFATGNRISGDSLVLMEQQFDSSLEVLLHDPIRVAKVYYWDISDLPLKLFHHLMWEPLLIIFLVCVPLWLWKVRDRRVLVVLAVTVASVLLLNMKAFETRYYLFILPVLGAPLGLALKWLGGRIGSAPLRQGFYWLLIFASAGVAIESSATGLQRAEDEERSAQYAQITEHIRAETPSDAVVMCRKCNAVFYADRADEFLPEVSSPAELCEYITMTFSRRPVYIALAQAEREMREELSDSLFSEPLPGWLEVTARGSVGGEWRLLRYRKDESCA